MFLKEMPVENYLKNANSLLNLTDVSKKSLQPFVYSLNTKDNMVQKTFFTTTKPDIDENYII